MITENPARLVRDKREKLNLSQKDFARFLGLTKYGDRTIRRWEKGETMPSQLELNTILAIPDTVPFQNPKSAKYKMIDLFAGIGGTRLGFQMTGKVKCVFSSEIDKAAAKTYSTNFGEMPEGDITQIDSADIPDFDILVGGFPCQAFSQAGKKLGFKDSRGTLFFEIARILKEKQCKAFLLENVKNLVSHDNGRTFKVILSILQELGYHVTTKVLRARDFGVPQNRERIYIVGFNKKLIPNCLDFSFPQALDTVTCVGDILEHTVDPKYTISDRLWQGHLRRKRENKLKGKGFGYGLFNAQSPYTNTISARYYKDGSEILIEQADQNPRKLTPREAARLQGFPDEFRIPVSDTQSYKQFGNSVAVPVINEIAKQILTILDSAEIIGDKA